MAEDKLYEEYRGTRTRCGQCGRPVLDDTTDFGNGLVMRTTCQGIEFRVDPAWERTGEWTPGISRDELLAFLGVRGGDV